MTPHHETPAGLFEEIFQVMPTAAMIWRLSDLTDPLSLHLVAFNPAALTQTPMSLHNEIGRRMVDIFPDIPSVLLNTYTDIIKSGQPVNMGEMTFGGPDGAMIIYELQVFPLIDNHICIVYADITDRKKAQEALRQSILQEEKLQAQNAALAELSTPLIPITDEVMVMPLIGALDSQRAQRIMETLLTGVSDSKARVIILDITGVPVVDTQVANALIRAAQALRLLGAEVILTGIRPEVAQTLVGLGADLSSITTRSSLQSGIASATGRQ